MDSKKAKNIKGVRIRTINYGMILMACILYALVIYVTIRMSVVYKDLIRDTDNHIACVQAANLETEGSDYLTMKARLYVVTLNPQDMEDYFTEVYETRRRDSALEELEQYNDSEEAYRFLEEALKKSNELMEREVYAMKMAATAAGKDMTDFPQDVKNVELTEEDQKLDSQAMLDKARSMVFDSAYQDAKALITSNVTYFFNEVVGNTREKQMDSARILEQGMSRQRLYISILFVMNIITFIAVIVLIVKPLQIYIRCIKEEKMLEISGAYEFKYLALTYNDIYEVNAANKAMLRHKAEHDPLTGIINRGGFDQVRQLLKAQRISVAFLMIDVDKFKQVNDNYGHEIGDLVLKKVAKLLQDSFRSKDYVARLGGDEFAVVMTEATPDMKEQIRNKVTVMNEKLCNPDDSLPQVSLSVGVAFSDRGFTDDLYRNTDSALYRVKENGRCGCDFYEEENG